MSRNDTRTQEEQCSPANLLDCAKLIITTNGLLNQLRFMTSSGDREKYPHTARHKYWVHGSPCLKWDKKAHFDFHALTNYSLVFWVCRLHFILTQSQLICHLVYGLHSKKHLQGRIYEVFKVLQGPAWIRFIFVEQCYSILLFILLDSLDCVCLPYI